MHRRSFLAIGASLAISGGLAACGGGSGSSSSGSGSTTLTLAPIVDAQPWDLKDAGLGNNTLYYQAPYDALLKLDTKANVGANLATEWAYEDSGNTVLALTLRSDVTFTDGTVFDATAVKTNLEHTKTGANEAAGQLKGVKSVEVVDATHVKITLTGPDPSFVANLGSVAGMMASPKAIEAGTLKDGPVGTGPYVMDKTATTSGSVYTFTRNADYWNADAYPFDKVVFKPMTDSTAALNALRSGQIDGTLITAPKNISVVESAGLNILKYAPGDVSGVYIWDRGGKICKPLGDVRVRQAINYAFDRATLISKVMEGMGTATTQVFNPSSTAYDASLNDRYPYDPAKAKSLLAEAGYADGFSCDTVDLSAFNAQAQAAMIEQLAAVGIKLIAKTVPAADLINQLIAGKFPISFFSLASFHSWDTAVIQLQPTSLWNMFKYEDPKVTALIDKAQTQSDADAAATFKELNTYIVDQAWQAPWMVVENAYGYSKKVTVEAQEYTPVPYLGNFKPAS
ncbi:ABC transporter substrate-binding protein [Actinoplanes sp. NPDC051851]|uniref:ABC transporter substrate-binding protein n=1 Tax=Actinoplanes sp. NPDC051851 TaxID=3154753 RepID=UPI00342F25F2